MTEKKEIQVAPKTAIDKSRSEPTQQGIRYVPDVDIVEDDDSITLFADMPGVSKGDVSVDLREGTLSLTATVEPVAERFSEVYSEYEIGGFSREFTVGERFNQEKISAKLEDGVLRLTLPKVESHKTRKIKIEV